MTLLLTITAAAQELSCSPRLVEKLIHDGWLPAVRVGRRARRVVYSDLVEYVARLRDGDGEAQPDMASSQKNKEAHHAASPARRA